MHHFGQGIVRTPNDFGTRGAPPTHPELLDWLAATFMKNGWSIKKLHRRIVTSATYQQSSELRSADLGIQNVGIRTISRVRSSFLQSTVRNPQLRANTSLFRNPHSKDPENRLLWRQNRRRLEAEAIRDAILSVSGDLDPSMGGEHPFPPVATWGFTQHTPFTAVYETKRRSVYLMQQRIRKHPFLALFDGAEPNTSTPERTVTTTPLQALFMMNAPFVHEQAEKLALRLLSASGAERIRVDRAYRLCFGRPAAAGELREAMDFLVAAREALQEAGTAEAALETGAWAAFARSLLSSNEFLFVD
jgi:hypothetical protein